MAVAADGEQWGTIGGGRIEQLVVAAAQRGRRRARAPRVVRQHLVRDLAMCCGGSMEVAITPAARVARGDRARSPGRARAHVLVTPLDGGPLVGAAAARRRSAARTSRWSTATRWSSGVGAAERAIVFGLGHVARTLGPLLASLGFAVIACDDGETGALDAAAGVGRRA